MAKQIVWENLPKRYNLFTKRSATMVSLDDDSIIMQYGANTKINFVQQTVVDGVRFFRTESAMNQGLNWAIKASSFILPEDDVASLEPSNGSFVDNDTTFNSNSTRSNKKVSKNSEAPKSEEELSEDKKRSIVSAFKRFFRRKK